MVLSNWKGEPPAPLSIARLGILRRRRLILKAIQDLTAQKGYPPSLREITAALGYKSQGRVLVGHMRALVAGGFVRRGSKYQVRTWRAVG